MRKVIILVILALLIFLCYSVVANGLEIGESFSVSSYENVGNASDNVDVLIAQLTNLNDIEYVKKQENLKTAIKTYNDTKEEYEELVAIAQQEENVDTSIVDIYDVDFLWTIIGNYGTQEGVALVFDVAKNMTSTTFSQEYTMCDLRFTVEGDYIPITEFVYHLEDDERLKFEISNFSIVKGGGTNLLASFVVKAVPVNNANLLELQTSVETSSTANQSSNAENQTSSEPMSNDNNTNNGSTTNTVNY